MLFSMAHLRSPSASPVLTVGNGSSIHICRRGRTNEDGDCSRVTAANNNPIALVAPPPPSPLTPPSADLLTEQRKATQSSDRPAQALLQSSSTWVRPPLRGVPSAIVRVGGATGGGAKTPRTMAVNTYLTRMRGTAAGGGVVLHNNRPLENRSSKYVSSAAHTTREAGRDSDQETAGFSSRESSPLEKPDSTPIDTSGTKGDENGGDAAAGGEMDANVHGSSDFAQKARYTRTMGTSGDSTQTMSVTEFADKVSKHVVAVLGIQGRWPTSGSWTAEYRGSGKDEGVEGAMA